MKMGAKRIGRERQERGHSKLDIKHDERGKVWLCLIPADRYRMTFDGKETGGIAFPLPPDLAANIGQCLIDEAMTATHHVRAEAH